MSSLAGLLELVIRTCGLLAMTNACEVAVPRDVPRNRVCCGYQMQPVWSG